MNKLQAPARSGPSSCRCTAGQARHLVAPHRPTRARPGSPDRQVLTDRCWQWHCGTVAWVGPGACVRGAVNRCTARKQSRQHRAVLERTVDCEGQTAQPGSRAAAKNLSMAHMLRFHALLVRPARPGDGEIFCLTSAVGFSLWPFCLQT